MCADAMPRLVCINPWDKRIGPNRYLYELLRACPALARNTTIVLPATGKAADEYREIGCQVEVWEDAQLIHFKFTFDNYRRLFKINILGTMKAWQRIRQLGPTVVVTNAEAMWLGGLASKFLGIPHLQVFHGLALEYRWGKLFWLAKTYLRWLSLWNAGYIAVSQTVAKMLEHYGVERRRIAVIPNSFDVQAIQEQSQHPLPLGIKNMLDEHSPVLVSLGRISPIKGQDLLVEALAYLKAQFPNLICVFGGQVLSNQGSEDTQAFYHHLLRRIQDLHLQEHVQFIGEVDFVPALLKRADVYVQPSRSESFCRAIIEAQICDVPVAAFAVGAIPEVLGPSSGVTVPCNDVMALANAISALCTNAQLRQSVIANGQRNIRRFASDTVAQSFRSFLQTCVTKNGREHVC